MAPPFDSILAGHHGLALALELTAQAADDAISAVGVGSWIGQTNMRHLLSVMGLGLLVVSPLKAEATDWEGVYVGLHLGQVSSNTSAEYEHLRGDTCSGMNFGSDAIDDGCEGNQNYSTEYSDSVSGRTIGVSLERLWSTPQGIIGVQVNLSTGSGQAVEFSETISEAWGDTLDVGVSSGSSVDARLVYGVPMKEWMPFVAVGVGILEINQSFTQTAFDFDEGVYPSVTETSESWASRGIWSVGVKRDIGKGWVLSADLSQLRSKGARLSREASVVEGDLRYPDTVIDSVVNSTEVRLGLSRKF